MAAGLLRVALEQSDGTVASTDVRVFGGDGIPLPIAITCGLGNGTIARYDCVKSGGAQVYRDGLPLYRFATLIGAVS